MCCDCLVPLSQTISCGGHLFHGLQMLHDIVKDQDRNILVEEQLLLMMKTRMFICDKWQVMLLCMNAGNI